MQYIVPKILKYFSKQDTDLRFRTMSRKQNRVVILMDKCFINSEIKKSRLRGKIESVAYI